MLSLRQGKLAGISLPLATSWLLGSCLEAKGKQELWVKQKPEVLAAKSALVRPAILAQVDTFTLADLKAQCPAVSKQLIKKTLASLKSAGKIRLAGRGRGGHLARQEIAFLSQCIFLSAYGLQSGTKSASLAGQFASKGE